MSSIVARGEPPHIALARQQILVGGLPALDELRALARTGCQTLVNVSGTALADLHGQPAVSPFVLHEHGFSDLFSRHPMLVGPGVDDPGLFLDEFLPEQQNSFFLGVQAACDSLSAYRSIFVFCHHGVGRSPAVALAVMRCAWGWPLPKALVAVRAIRPQAHISGLSVSASAWALGRLQT